MGDRMTPGDRMTVGNRIARVMLLVGGLAVTGVALALGLAQSARQPSEAGMYEDSEAAYQDLVRRGVPANRIILLGHSLGSGPLFTGADCCRSTVQFAGTDRDDGFGGHVDALYDHADMLRSALSRLVPDIPPLNEP